MKVVNPIFAQQTHTHTWRWGGTFNPRQHNKYECESIGKAHCPSPIYNFSPFPPWGNIHAANKQVWDGGWNTNASSDTFDFHILPRMELTVCFHCSCTALGETLARQPYSSSENAACSHFTKGCTEVLPASQHFLLCTGQTGTNTQEDGRSVTLRVNGTAGRVCIVWGHVTITLTVGSQ